MADAVRGEEAAGRLRLERPVRLAAEGQSAPLRARASGSATAAGSPPPRTPSGTRDIHSGWDVETEHYTIRTNHSIEAAVSLGVKLERLYRLWQQLFVRYYASEADVVALFDGRAQAGRRPAAAAQHRLLPRPRRLQPGVAGGDAQHRHLHRRLRRTRSRRAYFFAGQGSDDRTLYHEATHQLFHESRPVSPEVGRKANFWIVEGIAMFMESLRQEDGYYVLGGFDDERMHAARYRLLHDHFYVPLDELVGYGMEKLQKDPRIGTLYSQAAGLTHFLIFYGGGRYRDALVSYLSAVYTGRDDHDTLAKLTGQGYDELDKQYREFVEGKGEGGVSGDV